MMLSADAINTIKQFGAGEKEIAAIYVFGSAATGKARGKSDVDIAVMTASGIPGAKRMEMENTLSNRLKKDVDLVIFDRVSPLFQHQILKYGRLVYEADPKERVRQEVFARSAYLDTTFLYRKLKRNGTHG